MMSHIVRAVDPDGDVHFVAYVHGAAVFTGHSAKAARFTNERAANAVAYRLRWGEPLAFWESERRSAARTREQMRGWTFTAEPST
jgi:hypothetical protein